MKNKKNIIVKKGKFVLEALSKKVIQERVILQNGIIYFHLIPQFRYEDEYVRGFT
jgi:hypothetical protein